MIKTRENLSISLFRISLFSISSFVSYSYLIFTLDKDEYLVPKTLIWGNACVRAHRSRCIRGGLAEKRSSCIFEMAGESRKRVQKFRILRKFRRVVCSVKRNVSLSSSASRRAYGDSLQLGLYIKDTMRDDAHPQRCYLMFLRSHKKPNLLQ